MDCQEHYYDLFILVMCRPLRYNNQTYRIDDIEWTKNPQSTFMYHTGEQMSYVDYYK